MLKEAPESSEYSIKDKTTIIYLRTIQRALKFEKLLKEDGLTDIAVIHHELKSNQRSLILQNLHKYKVKLLEYFK
jgi:superfamily II DNA/RNA helicase